MKHGRTRIIASITIGVILLSPLTASAQYQPFNPNATLQMNGNTFGGIRFSGVGGAIASCTNFGGSVTKITNKAISGIKNLFGNSNSGGGTSAGSTGSSGSNTAGGQATPGGPNAAPSGGSAGDGSSGPRQDAADQAGVSSPTGPTSVPVTDSATESELQRQNQREECLDGVAYAVAKSLLQQVTEKVVSMVNTGNFGNPYYVKDLPSYLKTIQDEQVSRFLQNIPNQDPIFGNAIRSIVSEQITGVSDGLLGKAMDTPQGQAYQRFQDDFTNGGWEAFLDPSNNPLNSIFNAADSLGRNISTQQQDVKDQLQRNGGFLDMRRCVEYATDSSNKGLDGGPTATNSATDKEPQCLSWETVTPGSVISAQINAVTTSPIHVLENSDKMSNNIDQIFGSIFDNILNWLYNQGLGSLRGAGNNAFTLGTQGQNIVIGSNGQPINASSAQYTIGGYTQSGSGVSSTDFDVSRPQQIRTVLQVQYNYLNLAQDSQIEEERLIPVLGALDYCLPGPNPTWQDGLAENIKTYDASLQVEGVKGPSTGQTVAQTIIGAVPVYGQIANSIINAAIQLFGGDKPHAILGTGVSLYDKVTGAPVLIRDTKWEIKHHSPTLVYDTLQTRINDVMNLYKGAYTKDAITTAFINVDPTNADYVRGFIDSAFTETAKLPQYDQQIAQIDNTYTTDIANTKDAIKELASIQQEVNDIVSKAKTRYIQQQKAAGTPVNETCLNNAYKIDTTPVTATIQRTETDTASPYLDQSLQGAAYFYSHL